MKKYGWGAITFDNQFIDMKLVDSLFPLTEMPTLAEMQKEYGEGLEFVTEFVIIECDENDYEYYEEYIIENDMN